MNPNEQKILDIFHRYTSRIIESVKKSIESKDGSGFGAEVFAYHALKHRMSTYMGYAFEDIAESFGENMINLNLDAQGNRPKATRVRGVDLENDKYCIQLKSSQISENGTGKSGYDTALKNAAKHRNKIPILAVAICVKPKKRRKTHGITYAEGKDFWENYVGVSYEDLLNAKLVYEKELQMMVDSLLNKIN